MTPISAAALTSASFPSFVTAATTATSLTSSANPVNLGQSVTFTAMVAPTGGATGTPTGTVQFEDNGTDLGSPVTLDGSGQAAYTTSSLTTNGTITAAYSGDTTFSGSTSTGLSETVSGIMTTTTGSNASTTSVSASSNPAATGKA